MFPTTIAGKLFKWYLKGIRHPSKIRIQNVLGRRVLDKGIPVTGEDGTRFLLEPNDWITRVILIEGNYEPGSTRLAVSLLKPGGIFMDIGANFGLFTCMVARTNPKARVISVEPNYRVMSSLLHNISLNGLEDRVKILHVAVSDTTEFVSLQQHSAGNMGTISARRGGDGDHSILGCTLQQLCEQAGEIIELIKIDIEGNEFEIFQSFNFESCVIKNIILEFNHLSKVPLPEVLAFFKSKGFDALTIHGNILQEDIPENNIWFVNRQFT